MTQRITRGNGEIKGSPMYRLEVKVIDPEGQELLNVIKFVYERNVYAQRHKMLDVNALLEQLVEAAGEWPTQAPVDPAVLHPLPARRSA